MGYKFEIDREGRLARVWLFGKTSVEEQRQWLDDLVNDPDWSPAFDVLIDVRKLGDSGFDYQQMRMVGKYTRRLDEQLGAGRHAVVGDTNVLYGYARMAEQISSGCLRELAVFRDMESAEGWLGITPEEIGPHSGARVRKCEEAPPKKVSDSGRPL
jgi:hypothetical protein